MKIAHIFPAEKFTVDFITMINTYFSPEEHSFIIYGDADAIESKLLQNKNVSYCLNNKITSNRLLRKQLHSADLIIVHGLFFKFTLIQFVPFLHKIINVFWGKDLYSFCNKNTNAKNKTAQFIKKFHTNHSYAAATLIDGDYTVLQKYCKPKKHYTALYANTPQANDRLIKIRNLNKQTNPIKIIVGNSADDTNQHIDALKLLAKYKNENINIIVPLSYGGDNSYISNVIEFGKTEFGDKFISITEFMEFNKYMDLLNEATIGIFNNNRQQAMGNINSLAFLGAKVYIRKDTGMWDEYVNNRGCAFFDVETISNLEFNDFIAINDADIERNYNIRLRYIKPERFVEIWTKIFSK